MDAAKKLHTFARRTCMSRHDQWTAVYSKLLRAGMDRKGFEYTDEAYSVFPRYNVAQAVLECVETIDADVLPAMPELRALLVAAAATTSSELTKPGGSATEQLAMAEEREALARAFRDVSLAELGEVEPLFYRRTLRPEEVGSWRRELEAAWGARNDYWYPLGDKTHSSLVALELYGIDETVLQDRIRRFFADCGVARLIELREHGASCEVQADAAMLIYNGAEVFWTTARCEWIVYCSHEGTMTLGGKAASEIAPEYRASHYDPSQPPHWLADRQ